jgi:polysaccharide biosynthesis transport protein
MTFGQFLSILRARWWVVLLVLALSVGTTLLVSLLLPKQYQATASVVVDFKPDPISAAVFGGVPSPAVMATQVDIIGSERVALRVVRSLKLNENPAIRQQWQEQTGGEGTVEQWLISLFQRSLEIEPSRESSVIRIAYKAADPRFAAGLANAFAQAYIDTTLELRVNPARQYSGFFDQQVKELRDNLEKSQGALSRFQKENGIIATDERLDVENARLNELSSQLVALQAVSAESRSRQAQANSAAGERLQEVLNNPVVGTLKADISRGEARLKELNSRLGDNHPQVIESRANLSELRSRLETETRRVTGSVGITNTINNQREGEVRAALAAQRDKVLRMKAVRDEGAVLLRDLENAQRSYDAVQARLAQTNLESQTTQSNVNILTQAVPPVEPSSPRVLLNTILSVVVGTLLAVGVALALELRDRRIRTVDDVVTALELPVIGILPRPGARGWRPGRTAAVSAMQQRLMAPLPAPAREA